MANGRSSWTLIRGGTAFRSASRRSMRSLSEGMSVLLQGRGGEGDPDHGARRLELQQAALVRLDQKPLHPFAAEEEQLPVWVVQQSRAGWLVLLQVEGDVREGLHRQVRG